MKSRKPRNSKYTPPKNTFVMADAQEVWAMIEMGKDPLSLIKEYKKEGESKLTKQIHEGEKWDYCKSPYQNYIITSYGRVGTVKSGKFVKCYLRNPYTITVYMNGSSNVKIEMLMEVAGFKYDPTRIK